MPLRTIRWAEPGDIERCASLAKHYAEHWAQRLLLKVLCDGLESTQMVITGKKTNG